MIPWPGHGGPGRTRDTNMTTTYLSDDIWNQTRDELAASILTLQAVKLLKGRAADPVLVDAAREVATLHLTGTDVLPECCREVEA